jgi:uncharacterized protein (TIGR03437 family)
MLIGAACLNAAPRLRLSGTALGPYSIVVGTNGSSQTVAVTNIGDGTLKLSVTSSAAWLSGTYKAAQSQIAITLATSSLTAGSYTGILTVTDPNAIDVPQTITVTVSMGGTVPNSLTLFAPPGGSGSASFTTGLKAHASISTPSWLSVACTGAGSFQFDVPCAITASAKNLTANAYDGNVTFSGSTFAPDNKSVPVTFNVTTSPIADPGTTTLTFAASMPLGANAKQTQYVWINNLGQGTLTLASKPTVAPASATWLTVPYTGAESGGALIGIAVDPTGLSAGTQTATVTVDSNAANGPTVFNVELDVSGAGSGPTIAWPRILNISNFTPGEPVSQGDIVAVYGADLLEGDPINITATPPLPTKVGVDPDSVEVLVNGTAAPIFYASYGQINIQIPFETSVAEDAQIQVVRNGIKSPIGTVPMAARAPRILQLNCIYANTCPAPWGPYGIGVNTDASFPIPTAYPIPNSHPAKVGDVLVFYAVGLGQTSPALVTGAAAPGPPNLAVTVPTFNVCFYTYGIAARFCTPAEYSGATPNYVGLYQINVKIPTNAPTGDTIHMYLSTSQSTSEEVLIDIQ